MHWQLAGGGPGVFHGTLMQQFIFKNHHCCSHQEELSLHGGCVPGSKLEQTALSDELVGRVDHVLVSDHLVDLQQTLEALLQGDRTFTESDRNILIRFHFLFVTVCSSLHSLKQLIQN